MNLLKEIILVIFSLLIIAVTAVYSVILLGIADAGFVQSIHEGIINNSNVKYTMLAVNILFMVLALVAIFGSSHKKEASKTGVLLENEKGKLLISKETLENLVNSVLKGFDNVHMNAIRTELDADSKLNVNVSISVGENVVIKDLSNAIQNQVKETIKKASDLEVKNVNISIRGIIEGKKSTDTVKSSM